MILDGKNGEKTLQIIKSSTRDEIIDKLVKTYNITSLQAREISDMRLKAFSKTALEEYKEELKENATANLKEEKAKSKKADINLQSAEYGVFEGVATYAGIKKPLPKKMQSVLYTVLAFLQMILL